MPALNTTATKIYHTLDVNKTPRMPAQLGLHTECDQLIKKKSEILLKQAAQGDALSELLNSKDSGLIEVSRRTCKNLEAAVVASKRPGYFDYYKPPANVQQSVTNNEVGTKLAQMQKTQDALTEIEEKLKEAKQIRQKELAAQAPPKVKSLSEWMAHYGDCQKPEGSGPGWRTEVDKNPKIYGGTNHHMAFKTQAKRQKPGRLTK